MTFFKYRIGSLTELEAREQISSTERKQLEAAYDFLLRVRNGTSLQRGPAGRCVSQEPSADGGVSFGLYRSSPVIRLEMFMRDFYTHTRNIYLITRMLERRLALMKKPKRLSSFRNLIKGPPAKR